MPDVEPVTTVRTSWSPRLQPLRWIGVTAVGGLLLAVGVALLVLPGPGIPLLMLGLVLLATEFVWAQRLLHRMKTASTAASSTFTRTIRRKDQHS